MSTVAYNRRVFLIEDEDQRDQCQFIYVPLNGEKPKRCDNDGIYRIGLTIFLCGRHMPGVGRYPTPKPTVVREEKQVPLVFEKDGIKITESSQLGKLLSLLMSHDGQVTTYQEIERVFPSLLYQRNRIQTMVSQLRRWTGYKILSITHVGYQYESGKEAE